MIVAGIILFFIGLIAFGIIGAKLSANDDRLDVDKFLEECRNN